jgi:hypothetical protein
VELKRAGVLVGTDDKGRVMLLPPLPNLDGHVQSLVRMGKF